jgi:hypothetical protein
LADHFTVNPEALRHRLKRWKRSPAYTTDAVRVAKDGRLRYHLAPVRHLIEDLRGGRKSRFKA